MEYKPLRVIFKTKRKKLKSAIRKSKSTCFKELCDKADENIWGGAYKAVISKLRGDMAPCPVLLKDVVETLFSAQQMQARGEHPSGSLEPPAFLPVDALQRFGNAKAPGLDGILNRSLKGAKKLKTKYFTDLFNKCLRD